MTADLADEVLAGLYPSARPQRRSVQDIQERTCEAFGISIDDLRSTSRAAPVAWPRQVAMYLARELTDQTLPAIGRAFGGRNHTTVMHACRRTAERIATDREAYDTVRRLTERALGGPMSPDRLTDCSGSCTAACARPGRGAAPFARAVHSINSPDDHESSLLIISIVNPRRAIT